MIVYIQILGIVALILWCYSVQKNSRKEVLKLQTLANLFYAGQYFFLGAIATSFMNIISAIRMIIFYKNESKNEKNSIWTFIIFVILILLVGFLDIIYNGFNIYFLLPIIITIGYTYATWQPSLKVTRYIFLLAAFLWIGFNIKVGAYASIIGNILEIISGIYAIIKYDLEKKSKK